MDNLFQQFRIGVGAENLELFDQLIGLLQKQRDEQENLRRAIQQSNEVDEKAVSTLREKVAAIATTEKAIRDLSRATFEQTEAQKKANAEAKAAQDAAREQARLLKDLANIQKQAAKEEEESARFRRVAREAELAGFRELAAALKDHQVSAREVAEFRKKADAEDQANLKARLAGLDAELKTSQDAWKAAVAALNAAKDAHKADADQSAAAKAARQANIKALDAERDASYKAYLAEKGRVEALSETDRAATAQRVASRRTEAAVIREMATIDKQAEQERTKAAEDAARAALAARKGEYEHRKEILAESESLEEARSRGEEERLRRHWDQVKERLKEEEQEQARRRADIDATAQAVVAEAMDEVKAHRARVAAGVQAADRLKEAEDGLAAAKKKLQEATERSNVAHMTAKERKEALARAEKEAAAAAQEATQREEALARVQVFVAKAEENLAKARAQYGKESIEAAKAETDLNLTREVVANSTDRATSATERAVEAKKREMQAQRDSRASIDLTNQKMTQWTRTVYYAAQGIEDLQFSWMAFANNLPLIVQNATAAMGASSTAALAFAGGISLVGTAITIALPHIQEYINSHKDLQDGVKEFKETLKDEAHWIAGLGERHREARDSGKELREELERLKNLKTKVAVDYRDLDIAIKKERELHAAQQARLDSETGTTEVQRQSGRAVSKHLEEVEGGEAAATEQIEAVLGEEIYNSSTAKRDLDARESELRRKIREYEQANPGRTLGVEGRELQQVIEERKALREKLRTDNETPGSARNTLGDWLAKAKKGGDETSRKKLAEYLRKIGKGTAADRIERDSPEEMRALDGKTQEEFHFQVELPAEREARRKDSQEANKLAEDRFAEQVDTEYEEAVAEGHRAHQAGIHRRAKARQEKAAHKADVEKKARQLLAGIRREKPMQRAFDDDIAIRTEAGMEGDEIVNDLMPDMEAIAARSPAIPAEMRGEVARAALNQRLGVVGGDIGAIGAQGVQARNAEANAADQEKVVRHDEAEAKRAQSQARAPLRQFRQQRGDQRFFNNLMAEQQQVGLAQDFQNFVDPSMNNQEALAAAKRSMELQRQGKDFMQANLQAYRELQNHQLDLGRTIHAMQSELARLRGQHQGANRVPSNLRHGGTKR